MEKEDILQLWKFGFGIDGIVKKYAKDNKIKLDEAKKIVVELLYKEVTNDNRTNNKRCKSK